MENPTVWLGVAGFVLNVGVLLVTLSYKLSQVETRIVERLSAHRSEIDEQRDADQKAIGETFLALRQKIQEVEIWSRDTFARRDSVNSGISRIETQISALDRKMSGGLSRLDDKIDRRWRSDGVP